jgi:type II secretion system protein J
VPRPAHHAGFTLIELLIAMAIFAIMATLSYRTLDSVFRNREQLTDQTARRAMSRCCSRGWMISPR